MTTGVLVGLTILLLLAVAALALLLQLRRRGRPGPVAPAEVAEAAEAAEPQTVGDLVRLRTAPPDDLSGPALFTPRQGLAPVAPPEPSPSVSGPDGGPHATSQTVDVTVPPPVQPSPPSGEPGDAPWRRAARMMGTEPGGGWDTAPLPVVPAVDRSETAVDEPDAAADRPTEPVAVSPAPGRVSGLAGPRPRPTPRPADVPAAPGAVWTLPEAVAATTAPVPVPNGPVPNGPVPNGPVPNGSVPNGSVPNGSVPNEQVPSGPAPVAAASPEVAPAPAPSRPLSDPEMTPLMGIPIVRPVEAEVKGADAPGNRPSSAEAPPAGPPAAPARTVRPTAPPDDEVVWMQSPTPVAPPRAERTGSPQPVWFRVVRRDGEPAASVVVALLDDHGHEVDTTKTAADGGGELRAPHGGRFLMVASADGFQPRAALLTVDEQPVELALLLPRSSTVAGVVRSEGRLVTGARVVARQAGEVVDDLVTGRDGGFRFDDLAEGTYVLSATDHRGSVTHQVNLFEGAQLEFDLDLVYRDGAR